MTVLGSLTSLDRLPVEHPGAGRNLSWDKARNSGLYQQLSGCSCACRDQQVPSLSWSLPDDSSGDWVKTQLWTVLWFHPTQALPRPPPGWHNIKPVAHSRILTLPGCSNRTLLIMKLNTGGCLILSTMEAKCRGRGEKQATTKTPTQDRLIPTLSSDSLKYEKLRCSQLFAWEGICKTCRNSSDCGSLEQAQEKPPGNPELYPMT